MSAVKIEEAISALAERRFDAVEFPCAFLEAFGNKEVGTIRTGSCRGLEEYAEMRPVPSCAIEGLGL